MDSTIKISRSLTARYIIALTLIAVLTTSAWISLHMVISEQKSTAAVVNISGRQRMLSQRIAFYSSLLIHTAIDQRPAIREKLKESIDLMRKSHNGLIHGDPDLGLPSSMSGKVKAMYFEPPLMLHEQVETYLDNANKLIQSSDKDLQHGNTFASHIFESAPKTLVSSLDKVVWQYQLEGESAIKYFQLAETSVWLATLLLLLLEAKYIFHPFVSHIRHIIEKLQETQGRLREANTELEDRVQRRTHDLEQRSFELAESEEKFRLISASAHDAIVIMDQSGLVRYWNAAATSMFGYHESEVIGRDMHDLIAPPRYRESIQSGLAHFRQSGGTGVVIGKTTETVAIRKDGHEFPIELSASALSIKGNLHSLGIIRDISERKRMENVLLELATTDPLTGAPNRRKFIEFANLELERFTKSGIPASIMMADIDHFKAINDRYSHATGDQVLRHFTSVAISALRHGDMIGRLGGEEFGILLPKTDSTQAMQIADHLRKIVSNTPLNTEEGDIYITVSIGLYEFEGPSTTIETALGHADEALYRAKRNGRNAVELFSINHR